MERVSADAAQPGGGDDAGADLVERLRAGDEDAFRALLRRHHHGVVRVIAAVVRRPAIAEELAQEAWINVVRGLAGFDGRGSLKAWIFRIAINAAKARVAREAREIPASSLGDDDDGDGGDGDPTVDPARFQTDGRWVGHWSVPPAPWQPDEQLLSAETRALIARAIDELPPLQRQVITLRDTQDLDADETCSLLGITEANQRVLLHRARSKVRQALELHLRGAP
jgi:RNA polymerase sigma-70 factor (ECF subfamily)